MSLAGNVPTNSPGNCRPSARVTLNSVASATTCAFVVMFPSASNTMPDPSPLSVWMTTTDGETRSTTASYPCWSWARPPPDAGGAVAAGSLLPAGPVLAAAPVDASGAPDVPADADAPGSAEAAELLTAELAAA